MKQIILPPACLILLGLAGLVATRRRGDRGWWAVFAALSLLYALSTSFVADNLLAALEIFPPLDARAVAASRAQAIVVLSAESAAAPEFGGASVGPLTLARLRYGAYLHALTHLPLLVAGGGGSAKSPSMGQEMQTVLQREHGISAVWVEGASTTTRENAVFAARILRAKGVSRILLVTHAWHMPRARLAFLQAGLEVVPAPTAFTGGEDADLSSLLPSAKAVMNSYYASYEAAGWLLYRIAAAWEGNRTEAPRPADLATGGAGVPQHPPQ